MSKLAKGRIICDCCGREVEYDAYHKRQALVVRTGGLYITEGDTQDVCTTCRELLIPYLERIKKVIGEESKRTVPYAPWNTDWEDCDRGPTARLHLDVDEINEGESAIMSWEAKNATRVTLNGNLIEESGEMLVSHTETAKYTLVAEGQDFTATSQRTLTVKPAQRVSVTLDTVDNGTYILDATRGRIIRQYGSPQDFDLSIVTQVQVDVSDTYVKFTVDKTDLGQIVYNFSRSELVSGVVDQAFLDGLLENLGLSAEQGCNVTSINIEMSDTELSIQVWFTYDESETYHKYYFEAA